ncbi:DinB family protein [Aquipuribacter sp. SD81]|uniref:DinB family protein n=1 Tax=Aquipuribacter sp. SD81 TaxID=3127703 RepID=UPI00301B5BE7
MPIEPDTKDWTWVLRRPCPECGFDAARVAPEEVADRLRADLPVWHAVVLKDGAADRPDDATWSPLEYGCHVRDLHRVYRGRVERMLAEDDPLYDNWDQDATAVQERYAEQDPAAVAEALVAEGEATAAVLDGVRGQQWQRPGRRGDGASFTIDGLARYYLHDAVHHLVDVGARSASHDQP